MALVSDSKNRQIEGGDAASLLADERDLYVASRALKAMGHPLRLKILCILASYPGLQKNDKFAASFLTFVRGDKDAITFKVTGYQKTKQPGK